MHAQFATHIGTSGWSYPQWKNGIYAGCTRAQWFSCYSRHFSAVELNTSFYRPPAQASVLRWANESPKGFLFSPKAWRAITHDARLKHCADKLHASLQLYRLLEDKLGTILFQLPPSLVRDEKLLEDFVALLPEDLSFAMEFRHPSWQTDNVHSQLSTRNIALCHSHMCQWEGPRIITSTRYYARMHGSEAWFKGSYSDSFLQDLAAFIEHSGAKEAYVFFNNTLSADAATQNALALRAMLAGG